MLADNRDAPGLTAVLKQHAKYHAISERDREYSRTPRTEPLTEGDARAQRDEDGPGAYRDRALASPFISDACITLRSFRESLEHHDRSRIPRARSARV